MLKAPAQISERPQAESTRSRIVDAALETLKTKGFAGTSARSIARAGGFNQALIFYHFGTVTNLLLVALDETSRQRMEAYERLLDNATSLQDLISGALSAYRDDLDSGHITVLSEMIAGSLSDPEFGTQIASRVEPWVMFAERAIAWATKDFPVTQLLPPRDVAFAVVAFYLGVEVLNHLDGNRERTEALFELAGNVLPILTPLLASQ
jgi:AcrR family transcriptional regulator